MSVPIKCKKCGKEVSYPPSTVYKRNRKYCSWKCYSAHGHVGNNNPNWKGGKKERTCKQCGKKFIIYPSMRSGNFCSYECMDNSRKRRVLHVCEVCNKEFELVLSRSKRGDRCCSHECAMELRHRESIISKKCLQCDQIFEMLKSENKIFCSTKCLGKYRKENGMYLGSKNPRWLGGSSKYRGRDWNTKRLECLERDNFKCCKCNENNIVLHVHHIIPYRKTKNNDLENLIVLCVKCHNAEEATYRKYGIIGWLKNELQSM